MASNGTGAKSPSTSKADMLADVLGASSLGLGLPMVAAPGRFLQAIGVKDDAEARAWTYAVGAREHVAAAGILAFEQRKLWTWLRVAGDVKDLALLSAAWRGSKRADAERLRRAMAAVGGILALDLLAAAAVTRTRGADQAATNVRETIGKEKSRATHVRTAVTIRKGEEEIRAQLGAYDWAYDPRELEAAGALRLAAAPGGRGTEIHVDFEPGKGKVAAKVAKLAGSAPDQQISDDLRRFKQLVETGEIARSDGSPEGRSVKRMFKQRPAAPVGSGS